MSDEHGACLEEIVVQAGLVVHVVCCKCVRLVGVERKVGSKSGNDGSRDVFVYLTCFVLSSKKNSRPHDASCS